MSNILLIYIKYSRCRVVTRVRGEQGGTTGVLDGEIDEERGEREKERESALARAPARKDAENAAQQHNRHETIRRQTTRTLKYVYIYM